MYHKNLTSEFRLRLTDKDMDFLRSLSVERDTSISEVVRSIIGEYRRSYQAIDTLNRAVSFINQSNNGGLSNGDTKTDFNGFV